MKHFMGYSIHISLQVVEAVNSIATSRNFNRDASTNAACLLAAIEKFEHVVVLVITSKLLGLLKPLTVSLQSRTMDVVRANSSVQLVKECIQQVYFQPFHN